MTPALGPGTVAPLGDITEGVLASNSMLSTYTLEPTHTFVVAAADITNLCMIIW